ncbi:hypothetical protein [Moorena sp. SIO3H5]|uniref:hypothetical protein n=1 Tax=Moorena sp. SIO3H5 TaxID=2607834 RepID=UPI0013B7DEFF|nr:hypothetical protein [Moorena sp. SIO3H5]NEO69781.1 hypothetical protein [Moorena sp. SIO3H5]
MVVCKHSAVSGQQSVVSGQWSAKVTQIKLMLTCCLDAVAHGGNPLWRRCIAYSKAPQVACVAQASSL